MTNATASRTTLVLSNDHLRRVAPSIFADRPYHAMSDRYRFVPTIEVVDILRDRGFQPVRASQSIARLDDRYEFTKHMIRFRHQDFLTPQTVGTEFPELVLTNAHDGSSVYQFSAGIYRLACTNGMVCPTGDMGGVSVRHTGSDDFSQRIIDTTFRIVEDTPKVLEQVATWKQLSLPAPAQKVFAEAAAELLDNAVVTASPVKLLDSRRYEDRADGDGNRSLWTTFNAVQENVIKGGVKGRNDTGRRSTTRPVKSVDRDLKLNKSLWTLASKMAEIMGA